MEFDFVGLCQTILEYMPVVRSMWISSSENTINITFYNQSLDELAPVRAWLYSKYLSKMMVADFLIAENSYTYILDIKPPYKYIFCRLSRTEDNFYSWWRYLSAKPFLNYLKEKEWSIFNNFYSPKTTRSIIFFTKDLKNAKLHSAYEKRSEQLVMKNEELEVLEDAKKKKQIKKIDAVKNAPIGIKPGWNKRK